MDEPGLSHEWPNLVEKLLSSWLTSVRKFLMEQDCRFRMVPIIPVSWYGVGSFNYMYSDMVVLCC